jgi:hypothetical protein
VRTGRETADPHTRIFKGAEKTLDEGHGFSRAVHGGVDEGFSPWVAAKSFVLSDA